VGSQGGRGEGVGGAVDGGSVGLFGGGEGSGPLESRHGELSVVNKKSSYVIDIIIYGTIP
jgi:hypothetical protein